MAELGEASATSKVVNIQSLRAVAALLVVFSHSAGDLAKLYHANFVDPIPGPFGVELFFIISGFIITLTSFARFNKPNAIQTFLWHRAWRIVPLYWICTTLYIAVGLVMPAMENRDNFALPHVIASYLFWPLIGPRGTFAPAYALGWSLNFEVFFYVVLGAFLWLRPMTALVIITSAFLALALAHPLFPETSPLAFWSKPFIVEFVAGMWLAVAAVKIDWRAPSWLFWPGVLLCLLVSARFMQVDPTAGDRYVVSYLSFGLALLLGIFGVFIAAPQRSGLVNRWTAAVGDASFSLYLTHMFVIRLSVQLLKKVSFLQGIPVFVTWGLIIAATIAVALVSYRLVEIKFTNVGKTLRGRGRKLATAGAV